MTDQAIAMAHLRPLPSPTCRRCGRKATVTLYNGVNSALGDYCKSCGNTALRTFKKGGGAW